MKRFFITGTDTDCGKTYVTCQLLDYLMQQGLFACAIKPVASGCEWQEGKWVSDDVRRLARHNPENTWDINPWRYSAPVSPHIASCLQQETIMIPPLVAYCMHPQFNPLDVLLIEGAGGVMVPLNDKDTWLTFLTQSAIPVIVVVGMKLGCLNHALMTVNILKHQGITVAGFIANQLDPDMLYFDLNLTTLIQKLSVPCIAMLPYQGNLDSNVNLAQLFGLN